MLILNLILLIVAAVLFAVVGVTGRNLLAFGLFAWVCVPLFNTINALSN